jgi:Ca2+-binding EF-hand superfamily protein
VTEKIYMSLAKPFDSFDFAAVHRETSTRLAALSGLLNRQSMFSSRPATSAVVADAPNWFEHPLSRHATPRAPRKQKAKKVELSQGERRRRLEKALEADKLLDERNRRASVDFFVKNSAATAQPFGNRVDRFYAEWTDAPKFLTANILKEFELIPGSVQRPGNFPPAEFPAPGADQDVFATEFTQSEFMYLTSLLSNFVLFHRPSKEFPVTLVSRPVFARLLFVLGLVSESRFNRLSSLAARCTNQKILGALSIQECLELFDAHAQCVDVSPFPLCMHITRALKLLQGIFFETEKRSQVGNEDRHIAAKTGLAVMMSVAKIGNKFRGKNRLITAARQAARCSISVERSPEIFQSAEPFRVAALVAPSKLSTMRDFFFQVMVKRVEQFLEERPRKLEIWKSQVNEGTSDATKSTSRELSKDEKESLLTPPGVSRMDFYKGLMRWRELQEQISDAHRDELDTFAWKINEYVTCSLYEPEVALTSSRVFLVAREIVRAYSSADFTETLGGGGDASKKELERIGNHMKFSDCFRFLIDVGIYPEFVNFQQIKELYVGVDLLSEFTPVSDHDLQARRLDEEQQAVKHASWLHKTRSDMTTLSSVDQSVSVKALFLQFDSDCNGFLSPSEFHAAVDRLEISLGDCRLTREEIDRIMTLADSDSDGQLSLEEFNKALAHMKDVKQNFAKRNFLGMSSNESRALLYSLGKFTDRNGFDALWTKVDKEKAGFVTLDHFASYLSSTRQPLAISSNIPTEKIREVLRLFDFKLDGRIYEADLRLSLNKVQVEVRDPFHEALKTTKGDTQILFAAPAMTELLIKLALRIAAVNPKNFDLQTAPSFLKVHWFMSLIFERLAPGATAPSDALELVRASEKVLSVQVKGRRVNLSAEDEAFRRLQAAGVAATVDALQGPSVVNDKCGICGTKKIKGWGFLACRYCCPLHVHKLHIPVEELM